MILGFHSLKHICRVCMLLFQVSFKLSNNALQFHYIITPIYFPGLSSWHGTCSILNHSFYSRVIAINNSHRAPCARNSNRTRLSQDKGMEGSLLTLSESPSSLQRGSFSVFFFLCVGGFFPLLEFQSLNTIYLVKFFI